MNDGSNANIILIGFMGTGKTTVGIELASKLNMTFIDMDDVIEERAGKPISSIFAENGEPYFRNLERELVKDLSAKTGLVISTGGGVVLNSDNIRDYERTGFVVSLSARPEIILDRVSKDTKRPLLAGTEKMKKILKLLESRRELYDSIPFNIDTSDMTVDEIVTMIIQNINPDFTIGRNA